MNNRIFRVLKEGLQGVNRHRAMSFSSASAVTMTLLIIGVFIIFNTNVQHIVDTVENSVQIHAKVDPVVAEEDFVNLEQQIRAIDGVKDVTFSSKENELESFIEAYGEQGELFRMYVGEKNPMRNAFLIEAKSGDDIQRVAEAVEKLSGIEKVNYGGNGTLTLLSSMDSIKTGSYIVVAALGVLAVLLIANTIDTTINARKDEIFIMRTVGASNGFIRWPFLIEGIVIGLLGSIIPVIVLSGGYVLVYNILGGHLFTELFELATPSSFIGMQILILFATGILVGFAGSFLSVTKKLWWKR